MDWPQKTLLDSWCPKRKQVEIKITEKNGESLFNSLASKVMIAVIRMIKINMIRRAVIKSDHPGRNCCRRSVVTTGGAVARYHLLLGGPLRPLLPHTNDYQWSTLPTLTNTKSNADVFANKNDFLGEDPNSMTCPSFALCQYLQLINSCNKTSSLRPQFWGRTRITWVLLNHNFEAAPASPHGWYITCLHVSQDTVRNDGAVRQTD